MIKSYYYQFVNFIQRMPMIAYLTIWLLVAAVVLAMIVRFFKIYDGTQKKFEKLSLIILAILLIAFLVFFTYIRK